ERAAGVATRTLGELREDRPRLQAVADARAAAPRVVAAGVEGVDAREPAGVAGGEPAEGEDDRRRREFAREPERVPVADPERPVPDPVARDLGQVRRRVDRDLAADA